MIRHRHKNANNAEQAIAATISPASTKSTTAADTTKAAAVNTVADNDMVKRYFRKYTIPTIMQYRKYHTILETPSPVKPQ